MILHVTYYVRFAYSTLEQAEKFLGNVATSTGAMSRDLRCENINPIYRVAVEDALCSSGIRNLVLANVGFALVGVFLTVVAVAFILLSRRKGRHSAVSRSNSTKSPMSDDDSEDDTPISVAAAPIETVFAYPVAPTHHAAPAHGDHSKYEQYLHNRAS
jgi:hypothetical protein